MQRAAYGEVAMKNAAMFECQKKFLKGGEDVKGLRGPTFWPMSKNSGGLTFIWTLVSFGASSSTHWSMKLCLFVFFDHFELIKQGQLVNQVTETCWLGYAIMIFVKSPQILAQQMAASP